MYYRSPGCTYVDVNFLGVNFLGVSWAGQSVPFAGSWQKERQNGFMVWIDTKFSAILTSLFLAWCWIPVTRWAEAIGAFRRGVKLEA
jgi:hypothetical protein